MLTKMVAVYELTTLDNGQTEVKMISDAKTSPGFMIYLMKGQLGKGLKQHLFGLKYYIETGKTVSKDTYSEVFKTYK